MSVPFVIALTLVAALCSALLTACAIAYARRRGLLDRPGRRRSHLVATPRGGGIAIVAVMSGALMWSASSLPGATPSSLALLAALLAVAGVGWIDDHRSLPALPRLLVHLAAGALLAWQVLPPAPGAAGLLLLVIGTLTVATLINFWNFMDGINGLASLQAAVSALLLALLALFRGAEDVALLALLLAAACAGFLPFNFPRARIFLGDVGSGALGLLMAWLAMRLWNGSLSDVLLVLLPLAPFFVDAGLTLASRMLSGRRWYTAHRAHLYQWMLRRGLSPAHIVCYFIGWTLLTAMPVIITSLYPEAPTALLAAVAWGLAIGLWVTGRQRLLSRRPIRAAR